MDITGGYDFQGLHDQNMQYNMGSILNGYVVMLVFKLS